MFEALKFLALVCVGFYILTECDALKANKPRTVLNKPIKPLGAAVAAQNHGSHNKGQNDTNVCTTKACVDYGKISTTLYLSGYHFLDRYYIIF